jgi:hypothetical protein
MRQSRTSRTSQSQRKHHARKFSCRAECQENSLPDRTSARGGKSCKAERRMAGMSYLPKATRLSQTTKETLALAPSAPAHSQGRPAQRDNQITYESHQNSLAARSKFLRLRDMLAGNPSYRFNSARPNPKDARRESRLVPKSARCHQEANSTPMTRHFHLYHDGIEVELPPTYRSELQRYKSDSKRALASRSTFRRNRIKGHLASILNRMTLINSTTSILALFGAGILVAQART